MVTNQRCQTNAPPSLVISMAMRIRRYDAEPIAQYGRSRATLDATICRHWSSIRPVSPRRMPWSSILAQKIELWRCETAVLKLDFQKARKGPSTQLIEATSCVERLNAMIQAKELSYLSSHQTLIADKNSRRYHARTKLVKILTVMTVNSC